VVLDEMETTDDLVRDVTEVLTCLSCLYGRRSASRCAAKAVAVATGRAGVEEAGRVEG
jgi:putative resolvase